MEDTTAQHKTEQGGAWGGGGGECGWATTVIGVVVVGEQ